VNWLKRYRLSLQDGSSARVVRAAGWIMWGFTALWAVGLVLLLNTPLAGGTVTSTVVAYTGLLIIAYLVYSIVKLLFLPTRR